MNDPLESDALPEINPKKYLFFVILVWTLFFIAFLSWNIQHMRERTVNIAKQEARAYFNKDLAFRYWATTHGGVYVSPNDRTPPNPYLSHLPDRDVETTGGKKLTLMNPAYMLRQLMEEYDVLYGVKGRITSLKPLRPENAPDDWQREALKAFEKGENEVSGIVKIGGVPHMRLMAPMITANGCLKCHGIQGYKVGDVRGGVSVSVSMAGLYKTEMQNIFAASVTHAVIWLLGMAGIGYAYRNIRENLKIRRKSREKLNASLKEKEVLLAEVHHRVKNNMAIVSSLLNLQREEVGDEQTRDMLKNTQNRIHSMALVHEKLYQNKDVSKIDVSSYIHQMVHEIFTSFNISKVDIHLETDIAPLVLDLDTLIPCGLIINELISNSLKHAFKDTDQPAMRITLERRDAHKAVLTVADNGPGFPEDIDVASAETLGLKLVNALVTQLEGELTLTNGSGATFTIIFKI